MTQTEVTPKSDEEQQDQPASGDSQDEGDSSGDSQDGGDSLNGGGSSEQASSQ